MLSLQNSILSKLPYQELYNICFDETNRFQNVLDCSWEVWRDKAYFDFQVPPEFFDLAKTFHFPSTESTYKFPTREINGVQRYLEIVSYLKLTPNTGVSVIDGKIEGVYESVAGILTAIKRDDIAGVGVFFPRLTKEGKNYLEIKLLTEGNNVAMDVFFELLGKYPPLVDEELHGRFSDEEILLKIQEKNPHAFQIALDRDIPKLKILLASLRSGRLDFSDTAFKLYFQNTGLSMEEVPILPFRVVDPHNLTKEKVRQLFPLIELNYTNLYRGDRDKIMQAVVFGSNPQIVDFFRSFYGIIVLDKYLDSVIEGYLYHRKPVESYSLLQRMTPVRDINLYSGLDNTDLILYLLASRRRYINYHSSLIPLYIKENQGNIPLFLTLIPLLFEQTVKQAQERNIEKFHRYLLAQTQRDISNVFPLTKSIIRLYEESV